MTTEELKDLRSRVLDAINRELQPTRMSDEELLNAITSMVERESRGGYLLPIQKMDAVNSIYKMYRGLGGLLDSILADENVTEVMINGPDNIFVERSGRLTRVDKHFKDEQELRRVIDLIVGKAHREVSEANPIVDTRLEDGSRVNVVLAPIALSGSTVTIRKFSKQPMTMEKLLEYGSITPEVARFLQKLVKARYNIFIAGGTGSGKSTLIDLVCRFYDATTGTVSLFGHNVKEYGFTQLRRMVGIVPQQAVLFTGTIRDNMRWAAPDATDEEIWQALEIAQAADFVRTKPGMLDAPVETAGRNFSGGQRQRLTIARALVPKPKVLILDDSASALDFATDAALRKAIKEKTEGMTVFIVSQRAASVQRADHILVLDDGVLTGDATHSQLLKTCEVYKEICLSQLSKEEVEKTL